MRRIVGPHKIRNAINTCNCQLSFLDFLNLEGRKSAMFELGDLKQKVGIFIKCIY